MGGGPLVDMKQKLKQDVSNKIEKLLRAIEDKIDGQTETNIVDENVKCSMFGIFATNFKIFKEQQASDLDIILRKYFNGS